MKCSRFQNLKCFGSVRLLGFVVDLCGVVLRAMLRMTNLMCCSDEMYEDPHEIELLKEVNHEAIPSLDGSNHWKADSSSLGGDSVVEVPFIFGGSASTWLCPESIQLSDANPDSILACDIENDGAVYDESVGQPSASSESCEAKEPMDVTSSSAQSYSAELEIEAMIESPTDPVGKVSSYHRHIVEHTSNYCLAHHSFIVFKFVIFRVHHSSCASMVSQDVKRLL